MEVMRNMTIDTELFEAADVTIRCYLLGECIAAALEEIEDDFNEAHEGEESEEE